MKLQFPEEINNNKIDFNFSSSKKDTNKKQQNVYLKKYLKLYGNSFSDTELIDIFEKNDYNDLKIISDIKSLLSIGNDNKLYTDDNLDEEEHHSPSFAHNLNTKNNTLQNKKEIFINENEIPSDYPPPPKGEDNTNISNIDKNNLLLYKKFLFKKLKSANNTYKTNKNDKEIINYDVSKKNKEFNINKNKEIKLIELNKKNNNVNNISSNPNIKYQSIERKNNIQNNNITKEQKKKYIKYFFGNIKKYSKNSQNNIKRENIGQSPDFGRRKKILNISPDKTDLLEKKVLTYKKGKKIYYSNINSSYAYLKMSFKANDIFIPACYDNPQREQLLKMINEKRKQNPDKTIEFLFPQMIPMGQIPFYSNIYQPYNQINPYMNMYMPIPPIQYTIQDSMNNELMNNQLHNSNGSQENNNMTQNTNSPILGNSLNNNEMKQINDNHSKNQFNNNSNPNSLLINNFGIYNYSNKKSSGNVSNSGNINTTSSFKL
jgi:hypothetical protein